MKKRRYIPLRSRRRQIREKSRRGFFKFLFGRTTIISMLVILQAILLISLFAHWQFSLYAYGGTYILSLIMTLYLVNRTMADTSRETWMILVLLLPVLGTLLYLYVETDIGHRLVRHRLEEIRGVTADALTVDESLMERLRSEEPALYSLGRYLEAPERYPVYRDCEVTYFAQGADSFASIIGELEKAERFIFMEYFILEEGEMWNSILDILERKARQGVEVRVMYDGTNAIFRVPYRYPRRLEALGIRCKMFSPIRPVASTYYNNRDHRKILVIDGHTAYTGGINLADEYINKKEVYGFWKDTAVMVKGAAARSFTLMFLQLWCVSEREIDVSRYLDAPIPAAQECGGYVIPYGDNPFDSERVGESVYLDIINRADRYVYFMTPYLIIDEEMRNALCFAARRGVDVELILPHVPDKKSAFSLAYTHYRDLIRAGVRIYEFIPGFVHAKVCVCDDIRAVVGTINLDYRSLYLHFECALYMHRCPAIGSIRQDFLATRKQCMEITPLNINSLPRYRGILGVLLKLLAPLM